MAILTMEQFQKKLKNWVRTNPQNLTIALKKAAEKVRGEAVRNHLSGPKMSKGVGSKTNATLARISGDLAGSVNTLASATIKKQVAQISSNLKYANRHEHGTFGMPERSYLRSSLAKKRLEVLDDIAKAMIEGYKKA